ncbi:hypothetical protein CLOSTMETH_01029 [[Clostridium] methylpentosum DSM 5476]|uniref:Uncharacterized protein n=1 Tax=[Clostridium] methylpentosum DSM 5476 TaxID=537013 RepID=C0EB12_9FIRM|nr:hypothetical protein CLOSTMETH_01029 [[Clostridium] methylpentosum DSM 5476]
MNQMARSIVKESARNSRRDRFSYILPFFSLQSAQTGSVYLDCDSAIQRCLSCFAWAT